MWFITIKFLFAANLILSLQVRVESIGAFQEIVLSLEKSQLSGDDSNCDTDAFTSCAPPNTFPLPYPQTECELDHFCSAVANLMTCERHHYLTCDPSFEVKYLEEFDKANRTILRMCDKDSALHKALGRNIQCLSNMISTNNQRCFYDKRSILRAYGKYLGSADMAVEEMTKEQQAVYFCLDRAFEVACFLKNVEGCGGTEAKDASIEIITMYEYHLSPCPVDIKNKALLLLGKLRLEDPQKSSMREVLLMTEGNK